MRPSSLRRLGATLLFALYLPSCADVPVAPDVGRSTSGAASPAATRVRETTLAQGEYSLVVRHQGKKLHAVTATRGGKPLAQMRWQHRPDGQAPGLSARVWTRDGSVRDLPDVRAAKRVSADARLNLAPDVVLPKQSVGAYGCWYELSMVFLAVAAIWDAIYGENWSSLAGLFFALDEALQRYFDCLDQHQSPSM